MATSTLIVGLSLALGRHLYDKLGHPDRQHEQLRQWLLPLAIHSHNQPTGLAVLSITLAAVGGTFLHVMLALSFVAFTSAHEWLRRRRLEQTVRPPTSVTGHLYITIVLVSLPAFLVLLVSRDVTLLAPGGLHNFDVIQTAFGAQLTIGALLAAAIGLSVQLKASAVGAEIAIHQLRSWSAVTYLLSFVASLAVTSATLARWDDVALIHRGLVPDMAAAAALISTALLTRFCGSFLISQAGNDSIVRTVSDPVTSPNWLRDVTSSVNRHPYTRHRSMRQLNVALASAASRQDIQLFNQLVGGWVDAVHTRTALGSIYWNRFLARHDQTKEYVIHSALEADGLNALDQVHGELLRALLAGPVTRPAFVRALEIIGTCAYPPIHPDRRYHLARPSWERDLPGFRTLDAIVRGAMEHGQHDLAAHLIRVYWHDNLAVTVLQTERVIASRSEHSDEPLLIKSVGELLSDYVTGAAEAHSAIRTASWEAILQAMKVSTRSETMLPLQQLLFRLHPFNDQSWAFGSHWKLLSDVVKRGALDPGAALYLADRSVQAWITAWPDDDQGFHSDHDFADILGALRDRSTTDNEQTYLATIAWSYFEWSSSGKFASFGFHPLNLRREIGGVVSGMSPAGRHKIAELSRRWRLNHPTDLWLTRAIDGLTPR
ncbi:MAG: hypothetical protein GEU80_10655 [Dehalococcoidia bacterium]|nr:hypothetical protein [Dehalococcoidia bacterium]